MFIEKKNSLNKLIYLKVLLGFILISILEVLKFQISKKDKNSNIGHKNSVLKETKSKGNIKSNIDSKYDFFQIKEVNDQIQKKNLTYIETLSGGYGNIGNVLIMINNLINICEQIILL